jgi:acylphosphatase
LTSQGTETTARVKVLVGGVVQGVGFRYFVLTAARAEGLGGFVMNLRDGRVEVVSEGPRASLERLVGKLETGPRHGLVSAIDVEWSQPTGEFVGFDVRF